MKSKKLIKRMEKKHIQNMRLLLAEANAEMNKASGRFLRRKYAEWKLARH